jgi:hypothetical protein
MWGALVPALPLVNLHSALSIDRESLVGIDGNAKETRVSVDELILVPDNRVPEYASVIEIGQPCHVIAAVKLWRVHLANLIFLEDLNLKKFKATIIKALLSRIN